MSEIARLRELIERECEAMDRLFNGFAKTASHDMINHRYDRIGKAQNDLANIVGETEAARIAVETYIRIVGQL